MNEQYARSDRHISRCLTYQIVLVALFIVPLGIWPHSRFCLGGLVCTIANLCFIGRLWVSHTQRPLSIVSVFYQAQAIKWAVSIVLFLAVFTVMSPIKPIVFFGGFIMVQVLQWLIPLLSGVSQSNNRVVDHSSV